MRKTKDQDPSPPTHVMLAWFNEKEMTYNYCEDSRVISANFELNNLEVRVYCGTTSEGAPFLIVKYPMRAPEPIRGAVGEFLLRLNFAAKRSLCELDFNDGEIRLRVVSDLVDEGFTQDHFAVMMGQMLLFADMAYPCLASVMTRAMKPDFAADQAVAAIHEAFERLCGGEGE